MEFKMDKYLVKSLLATILIFVSPIGFSEDIDLYISSVIKDASKNAQVLIIFDTSGSMDEEHSFKSDFNSANSYTAVNSEHAYDDNTLYYERHEEAIPNNKNDVRKFSATINGCEASKITLADKGYYIGRIREYRGSNPQWKTLRSDNSDNQISLVDCQQDAYILDSDGAIVNVGSQVNGSGVTAGYPSNGNGSGTQTPNEYYDNSLAVTTNINWSSLENVTLYTGKYLRWHHNQSVTEVTEKRIVTAKRSIIDVIDNTPSVNFGLEAFNFNYGGSNNADGDTAGNGGRIVLGIKEMTTLNQTTLKDKINALLPVGSTPLCESVYEASQYFAGSEIDYGDRDINYSGLNYIKNTPTWESSLIVGGKYTSPFTDCASTIGHIILVTDGSPQFDNNADSKIQLMKSEALRVSANGEPILDANGDAIYDATSFSASKYPAFASGNPTSDLSNLPALAGWMSENDINLQLAGKQTVITHTIGFSSGVDAAKGLLDETARRSGGKSLFASSESELTSALQKILLDLPKANDTLTAASVAANNFDRTQTLDSIYYAMFEPQAGPRWQGNLKKYKVINKKITDVYGNDAMCDVDGRTAICNDTKSFWSTTEDGNIVGEGGVVEWFNKTSPLARKIYMDASSSSLVDFNKANLETAFTIEGVNTLASELGVDGLVDSNGISIENIAMNEMIAWAKGADVDNDDASKRSIMRNDVFGDPLHSKPIVINYGSSIRIVIGTNAGALHMFKDNGASVQETWAFMPKEFIDNIKPLRENDAASNKIYGIDGEITVYLNDVGGDGTIGTGDTALIFFGLRRGGSSYYAVDISTPDAPKLLWHINNKSLGFEKLGQSWSQPKVGYSKINASGDKVSPVLFIGGGYDVNKDEDGLVTADQVGVGIYMLDALTGTKLWSALPEAGTTSFDGVHSIASPIGLLDSTGNGLIDRLYTGDTGGSIWRVDMPGDTTDDFSVFELAKLGGGIDDQRFFYEPSIARTYISELVTNTVTNSDDTTETIISHQQIPYDAIIIGSGDRSDPLGFDNNDTLYMIKDSNIITKKFPTNTESVIDKPDPIPKNKLYDYTDDPYSGSMTEAELLNASAASGWYINLLQNGEKASAAGIVVNGVVYFTSYTPALDQTTIDCKPPEGKGSLYAVDLALGIKRHNLTAEDVRENDHRVIILGKDWPAPPSIVIVPHPDNPEEIQNNLTYKDKFIDVDTIFSTKRTYLYSTENQ
ncbi:MAG: type IV pilus assembly protein PilY1 [Colwellia sp.]|jgi:type IV pilus assembly protein PilY1